MFFIIISSRGQTTRGGHPAWGLGVGLTTPHRKKQIRYEKDQWALDLDGKETTRKTET
jgi:hypothetical protein